jgi:hypothetical protein
MLVVLRKEKKERGGKGFITYFIYLLFLKKKSFKQITSQFTLYLCLRLKRSRDKHTEIRSELASCTLSFLTLLCVALGCMG